MTHDALVIGAGPAGSAAARLLAAWGHRVLVVHRPGGDAGRLAESIPPSAQNVLAAIGALPAVESAGFQPWLGNTVWWADESPRVESFAPGLAGHQVVRSTFDALLQKLAVEAGAGFRSGIVRDLRLDVALPTATLDVDGRLEQVAASFVIDASGRSGVIARRGWRVRDDRHHTIALAGIWHSEGRWSIPDESHTLVASYADGWAWSVPTGPGARQFTVMVDPARTELVRERPPRGVYLAELAKVVPFGPVLANAALVDGPWGADASLYSSTRYTGPGFLLAGDAASFIDPLSSFGVKKALASGWLAAIAVHTALTQPAMRDDALGFFERRERAMHASARRQAQTFAADAAARSAHPFWLARATTTANMEDVEGPGPAELAADLAVRATFEDLRSRAAIRLQPTDTARPVQRPAVRGREIVLDDHLVLPLWPDGIRYIRGVDLVDLVGLAPQEADVGALYDRFARAHAGVSLPDFLGALSLLIAQGALCHD
jgi:flavin-dependent dehydrogenase